MSVKRRLVAAGMPAAGVTVLAALALTGQPASAATVDGTNLAAVHRVAVAGLLPGDCVPTARVKCGYDDDGGSAGDADNASSDDPDTGTIAGDGDQNDGTDDGTVDDTSAGSGAGATDDPSASSGGSDTDSSGGGRGNDGYGGVSPSTSPTPPTPSPTTPSPQHEKPTKVSPTGETLPVTGAPISMIATIGVLLAAAGAGIMVALRRRRNA